MIRRRFLLMLATGLGVLTLAGCGTADQPSLQASPSTSGCQDGHAYQHATLGYKICFPNGWATRDYTAEPGSGGAQSVVAFGPPAAVPTHVPSQEGFAAPVEVRVVAGAKGPVETSLTQNNQLSQIQVAGVAADRIEVTESGPAAGAIYIVFEHQANTYVIQKGPGSTYSSEFQKILGSFTFSAASG
ncbi:MAG: hypothetical protein M3Z11_10575 [Candidatus Dormibacteraeota bacterium]|nr:hypothetical protein [Candidatus Dormibacteraeota bacterium]